MKKKIKEKCRDEMGRDGKKKKIIVRMRMKRVERKKIKQNEGKKG